MKDIGHEASDRSREEVRTSAEGAETTRGGLFPRWTNWWMVPGAIHGLGLGSRGRAREAANPRGGGAGGVTCLWLGREGTEAGEGGCAQGRRRLSQEGTYLFGSGDAGDREGPGGGGAGTTGLSETRGFGRHPRKRESSHWGTTFYRERCHEYIERGRQETRRGSRVMCPRGRWTGYRGTGWARTAWRDMTSLKEEKRNKKGRSGNGRDPGRGVGVWGFGRCA